MHLSQQKYCLLSLVLAVLGLGLHFSALSCYSRNMQLRAKAVTVQDDHRAELRADAEKFSTRGGVLHAAGGVLAVASAILLVISFVRHEAAPWRSVSAALIISYVLSQFILV